MPTTAQDWPLSVRMLPTMPVAAANSVCQNECAKTTVQPFWISSEPNVRPSAAGIPNKEKKSTLAAHTLLHLFFGCHIQETTQFFVQLLADLLLSKQRSQSV